MPVDIAMFDGNNDRVSIMEGVGPFHPLHTDVMGFPSSHVSILGGMDSWRGAVATAMVGFVVAVAVVDVVVVLFVRLMSGVLLALFGVRDKIKTNYQCFLA